MPILEAFAIHGWSLQETADAFQVTAATTAPWMKTLEEQGAIALVQIRASLHAKAGPGLRGALNRARSSPGSHAIASTALDGVLARDSGATAFRTTRYHNLVPRSETAAVPFLSGRFLPKDFHVGPLDTGAPSRRI